MPNSAGIDPPDPLIGRTLLGRYRIEALIGSGGWGLVYKARHTGLNTEVALKVLHLHLADSRDSVARFKREAEAASRLTHPHIVKVTDYGLLEDGRPFMAMDFLEGQTFADTLAARGADKWQHALPLFVQAMEGIAYAHRKGLLHRDVKPANVFVTQVDGVEQVKLLDFGMAKWVSGNQPDDNLTATGATLGTPAYMSPEQVEGKALDRRSDIYSFGYTMYEVLTGTTAFEIEGEGAYAVMHAHRTIAPRSFVSLNRGLDVPAELEAAIMRALSKSPDDRFASAEELIDALKMVASRDNKPASRLRAASGYERLPDTEDKPKSRAPAVTALVIGLLVAAVAGGLYFDQQHVRKYVATSSATPAHTEQAPIPVAPVSRFPVVSKAAPAEAHIDTPKTDAEKERLKSQVKQLEARLKEQQKQLTADKAKAPPAVNQAPMSQAPVNQAPVSTAPAGQPQNGTVIQSTARQPVTAAGSRPHANPTADTETFPSDLSAQLSAKEPTLQTALRCKNWLKIHGFNYAVEDYLRRLLEPIDPYGAHFYINDILKHKVMDERQLDVLSQRSTNPNGAPAKLLENARVYKHFKFLRSACQIRAGQLFAMRREKASAQRCFQPLVNTKDRALYQYSALAVQLMPTVQ